MSNDQDPRKNSTKVVAFDLTDPEISAKFKDKSAALLAILYSVCDSPVEAYAVLHFLMASIERVYDIAGIQKVRMPTEKLQ